MTVYLETIHGSRLYGFVNADSDYDTFRVVDEVRGGKLRTSKQVIDGNTDLVEVGLTTFMISCANGTPQYLEAMFSPVKTCPPGFAQMFDSYRVDKEQMYRNYTRIASVFAEKGTYKALRHALRLLWNLGDAMAHGNFNPVLEPSVAFMLSQQAGSTDFERHFQRLLDRAGSVV